MTPAKPGYREFVCTRDDKSTILLSVRKPTHKELEYADLEYSAKFNQSICNGIPTHEKLLKTLRENGEIDAATEAKLGQLATDAQAQEKLVARDKFGSPEDKQAAQAKLDALYREIQEMNSVVDSYFEHTAQAKAQQAQRNFLIACVVEVQQPGDQKGKRLWGGVEEMMQETDNAVINRVVYEYTMCRRDMPSEWDKLMADEDAKGKDEDKKEEAPPAPPVVTPEVVAEIAAVSATPPPAPPVAPAIDVVPAAGA